MRKRTYVYIAGPYMDSGKFHDHRGYHEIDVNISRAREAAVFLASNRVPYFCPHLNSCHFEVIAPTVPSEFWYEMDLQLLRPAAAVLLLDGWGSSHGTRREIDLAEDLDIPIFFPAGRRALVRWWRDEPS